MSVEERADDGPQIIIVCGELERVNVRELSDSVAERLASGDRRLLFDFSGCSFIDSSALGLLLDVLRDVGKRGLVGVIAPRAPIVKVFDVMGLLTLPTFRVFDTTSAALAYLAALD